MDKPVILIIDDDAYLRRTLSDILKVKGYEPLAAKDGTEGLALAKQHRPHVALIDLGLPDMPGLDVLQAIRTDLPFLETIIVTGNATLESAIEATNQGAFSYIQKPYDIERLLLMVRRAVEKWELADKVRHYREHLEDLVRERTRKLEEARDAAEAGSRAKTDFIANMSHELMTPLSAIIGFSEVLQDDVAGNLNEKQKDYLKSILAGGRTLHDLILSVLRFSEAESGRLKLQTCACLVRDMVGAALSIKREDALSHVISLSSSVEPEADTEIEADGEKLKLVLSYLLSNALKFTPDGGSVRVAARLRADLVEISVADTGIGIRKEDLPRLFREFTQLEDPITKKYRGAGLGLALARKLVELHGGSISVESEFGKGSTFRVSLPVKQPEAGSVVEKQATGHVSNMQEEAGEGARS